MTGGDVAREKHRVDTVRKPDDKETSRTSLFASGQSAIRDVKDGGRSLRTFY